MPITRTVEELMAQREAVNALPIRGRTQRERAAFISDKRSRLEAFDRLIQQRAAEDARKA